MELLSIWNPPVSLRKGQVFGLKERILSNAFQFFNFQEERSQNVERKRIGTRCPGAGFNVVFLLRRARQNAPCAVFAVPSLTPRLAPLLLRRLLYAVSLHSSATQLRHS